MTGGVAPRTPPVGQQSAGDFVCFGSTVTNGNKRIAGRGISRLALLRTYPYLSVQLRTGRMSSASEPRACTGIVAVNKPVERLLAFVRIVAVNLPMERLVALVRIVAGD